MLIENFRDTIYFWVDELERYDFVQLCAKPAPNSWSLGQVYMHLIENTIWFMDQVKTCVSANENAMEDSSPAAKIMFLDNSFPDEVLEGPPENANTQQPENKEQLLSDLINLKDKINHVEILISESQSKGKTKHPGLGYLNAVEWFQFAEMHFRHHLRQKKRIDDFLKMNNY